MYTVVATVQRLVTETYEVTLDCEDPEAALDVVYEHFSEYPNSEFELKTRRRIEEHTEHCTVMDVEHKREESSDIGERVFNDDDTGGAA